MSEETNLPKSLTAQEAATVDPYQNLLKDREHAAEDPAVPTSTGATAQTNLPPSYTAAEAKVDCQKYWLQEDHP